MSEIVEVVIGLRKIIQEHMNNVIQRDQELLEAIDTFLTNLGVKTRSVTGTRPMVTVQPREVTQRSTSTQSAPETIDLTQLTAKLNSIDEKLGYIISHGIRLTGYNYAIFMVLNGNKGITKAGNSYEFPEPVDYLIVSPTVQTIISFNEIDATDNIPPIVAGGQIGINYKVHRINYRATSLVPESVLPAQLNVWAFRY